MRRLLTLLLPCAGALALVVPAATAAPIVPGATPLWMDLDTSDLPAGCPTPGAINGAETADVIRAAPRRSRAELVIGLTLIDSIIRRPTVLACDPAPQATRTILGPITGDSALAMQDRAFWGERALVGTATEGADGLRPGDRLTLPPLGSAATIDLTIAAGDATTTVRIPASTDPPTAARVSGTLSAPSLILTRQSGREETQAITPPAARTFKLRWTRRGTTLRLRLATTPGSVATLLGDGADASVVGARGRATLQLRVPRRGSTEVSVMAYHPGTRAVSFTRCRSRAARPVRCGTVSTDASVLAPGLLGPGLFTAVRVGGTGPGGQPRSGPHRTAMPALLRRQQRAAAPAPSPLAPASISRMAKLGGAETESGIAGGDVNGDGLPDGVSTRLGKTTTLHLSDAPGTWRSVRLTGGGSVLPDLDGDGRGELIDARSSVIVTDALAGASRPSAIDLGARRQPRARDLVLGDGSDSSLLSGPPSGTVPDVTGDGRPELVVDADALGVLPSEALPYGRKAQLAEIFPSGALSPRELERAFSEDEDVRSSRLSWTSDRQRLFSIAPRDPRSVDATPRPIDLDERDPATGAVRARRTFTAPGEPTLADLDAQTGDALVVTETGAGCGESAGELDLPDLPELGELPVSPTPSCQVRVLRVDAAGRVVASFTTRRYSDQAAIAVFAPDASDPDSALEVLVARTGFLNPGELHLATSSTTGTARMERLPRIDLGGKRRDDLVGELSVAVLPNGSRWPAIVTVPVTREREDAPSELLLVQPK